MSNNILNLVYNNFIGCFSICFKCQIIIIKKTYGKTKQDGTRIDPGTAPNTNKKPEANKTQHNVETYSVQ